MNKITPFKNFEDATATLDNGGRFYNLMTKAADGNISVPELGKVAGVFNDRQKMVLYFAMSVFELEDHSKNQITGTFSGDLKRAYEQYKPQVLLPSEAESKGIISSGAIITGIPKLTESKSDFKGFIIFPLSTGKTTTLTMIPLIDRYDVYEMKDDESSDTFFIAHTREADKLPEKKIRVGGIHKELKLKNDGAESQTLFLEALHYCEVC